MQQPVDFYVSQSSQGSARLDASPMQISMRWRTNGEVVRIKNYTLQELEEALHDHKHESEFCKILNEAKKNY